jgi:hypothetical protein
MPRPPAKTIWRHDYVAAPLSGFGKKSQPHAPSEGASRPFTEESISLKTTRMHWLAHHIWMIVLLVVPLLLAPAAWLEAQGAVSQGSQSDVSAVA